MPPGELQLRTPTVADLAVQQREEVLQFLRAINNSGSGDLTKVLERVAAELSEVQRLSTHADLERKRDALRVSSLVARPASTFATQIHAAWEHADALKMALVEIGDDAYVGTLLESEYVRQMHKYRLSWDTYLDAQELDRLVQAFRNPPVEASIRDRAVERLLFMAEKRRDDGAHLRARHLMRSQTLRLVLAILAPTVALVAATIVLSSDVSASTVGLCVAIGALGATLSGALRARDLVTMNDLRSVWAWTVVQSVVGAGAAVFMVVVLASGIIDFPGTDAAATSWAVYATYAFIAGFSEPFLLGVVARFAASGSKS